MSRRPAFTRTFTQIIDQQTFAIAGGWEAERQVWSGDVQRLRDWMLKATPEQANYARSLLLSWRWPIDRQTLKRLFRTVEQNRP